MDLIPTPSGWYEVRGPLPEVIGVANGTLGDKVGGQRPSREFSGSEGQPPGPTRTM